MKNNINGNAAQMEAILHKDGPAMVLAGPGSGKTFVIVNRLVHLIRECSVDPSSVLVITFTKAAAIEMQHRFLKITDSLYPEVCFGTFHSVFYQIIRQSNPSNKLKIIAEKDKYKFIKDIILKITNSENIDKQESLEAIEMIGDIISEISRIKNTALSAAMCQKNVPLCSYFPRIYKEYNELLKEFGLVDFDDMILRCYELLINDEALLDTWSRRFKYVLIDEYQDINLMQYKVIRLLCRSDNLFVVGDDDQSIYGFRGSDPGIMQKFSEDFRSHKPRIINLNINYRCGKQILYASNHLIRDNKIRLNKELKPDTASPNGFLIPRRYINRKQQSLAIIKFLKENMDKLQNIALIFRTNSEALAIAGECKQYGIPTNLDTFAKSFTDSPAVKLCENYLRFVYQGKKREFFLRIMNNPNRYITRNALSKDTVNENDLRKYYYGNSDRIRTIEKLFRQLNMIAHMRPSLSIRFLRNEVGIDKLYPGEIKALDELSELACKFPDNEILLREIEKIREESMDGESNKGTKTKGNCVKLLTMHGSKGLEFDIVWLPGLNEGVIPSRSSVTIEQIEEERRMLYVGMTRAKKALIMSYLTGNAENPMLPSRFLRPIRNLWEDKKEAH
ncbi:ATP-dependent helicase [Butyrivibrio sp. VCB2006]|uniref:ATP-dependent helicase n=1 Tax=Butyrivibrio sp. VCB2006 TaxID=1280679 RepID=UPI000492E54D|nr:ATP-dependent helicase [Butyrivibrio sp. VCB2006]